MHKRKKFLIFKMGFLNKMRNLKNNGKKMQLYTKIDDWIEDNIDMFMKDEYWRQIVMNQQPYYS